MINTLFFDHKLSLLVEDDNVFFQGSTSSSSLVHYNSLSGSYLCNS